MVSPETHLVNLSWMLSGGTKLDLPFLELLQQQCCRQSRAEQPAESLPATLHVPQVQINLTAVLPPSAASGSHCILLPEPWHPPLPGLLSKGISFQGKAQASHILSLPLDTLLFNFITLLGLPVLHRNPCGYSHMGFLIFLWAMLHPAGDV